MLDGDGLLRQHRTAGLRTTPSDGGASVPSALSTTRRQCSRRRRWRPLWGAVIDGVAGAERLVGEEVDQHGCGCRWRDVVGLAGEGAALAIREGVREDTCGVVQHGHAVLAVQDEGG